MRLAAYLRVSTTKQDVQRQRTAIIAWAAERGQTVSVWFQDEGYSRDLPHRRPDFVRMIEQVEQGKFDALVVDSGERFGTRDALDFGFWASRVRDAGCDLWSVAQGNLTAGDLATQVLGAVERSKSTLEQRDTSRRVLGGMRERAARGEWLGGVPPFAFDLQCVGLDGAEKWRLRYEGTNRRLKTYPDGRQERYDGEGNSPPKDRSDRLFLVPSDPERVAVLRRVFQLFATEAISVRGLAQLLNDLKVPPATGTGWCHFRVTRLLKNPVYRSGVPTWNKQSQGRFHELVDGKATPVEWVKGQPPKDRHRPQADHVVADRSGEALVDAATWERVQVKLASLKGKSKAPKSSALWLAGLAFCWKCGKRLGGCTKEGGLRTYCCSQYRTYGRANQFGCELHQVRHDVLEHYVDRYLADTGQALDAVLADEELSYPPGREDQLDPKQVAYHQAMTALWRAVRSAGLSPPDGQAWSLPNLVDAFVQIDRTRQHEAIEAKLVEMDHLLEQFAKLTSQVAQERANLKIEALGREVEELRSAVQPLDEQALAKREALEEHRRRVRECAEALEGDAHRRKAEALSRLVARIVCRFRYEPMHDGRTRSVLEGVTFEPVFGEAVAYGAVQSPGRPLHPVLLQVLGRTYAA